VARLAYQGDNSSARSRILRYTTPFSLAGVPVVTIPAETGGMQLAAAREDDEALAELAAKLGARRRVAASRA
jgi:Asp-tRNA(Asn)/Glu-tRNA(Gln) amidotransferase A subunit family amidase